MTLYLDDDCASALLARHLRRADHDVLMPGDVNLSGAPDPVHFLYAIQTARTIVSSNHDDFLLLHQLVVQSNGHHPGILMIRWDNDSRRDITERGVANAIRKLNAAGVPVADQFVILNHWR